jgi:hypothetical protein
MKELAADAKPLNTVSRGLAWAVEELPRGRIERGAVLTDRGQVRLLHDPAFDGTDGFEITAEGAPQLTVAAARPRAFLAGILNLAVALRRKGEFHERISPRFTSRLYKHEANIVGPGRGQHTWVGDLDEDFWVKYVKALVRMHFTGLVFYTTYHPFEYFLDYDEFSEAPGAPARLRAATLAGLKRAFGVARSFGLETFMQHYLTHFPSRLARKHNLALQSTRSGARLSGLEDPIVDAYSRYVYRRTFEILPELSGLYCNFESAANSGDFVKRCLFPEIARAKHKPTLVFRLWDFNAPPAMKELLAACPTKFRLAHKVMDRSDAYYFPKADPRVIEWKRFLGDVEFMFLVGPCHNSATAQSRKLWTDADFLQAVLADAQAKGADSFAFHTVFELLAGDIDARKVAGKYEIEMALLNRGHLDAAVDYVRAMKPNTQTLVARAAARLGVTPARARLAHNATKAASQVSLLTFQQHFMTSSEEGYLYPYRTSLYQDPFLYPTMRFANDEPWAAMTLTTSWLNRNLKIRNVGDDVQPVIDYANPALPNAPRHPMVISRLLRRESELAMSLAKRAAGKTPTGVMSRLVSATREMYNWGMRVHHETNVAVNLFGVFFSASRARTVSLLDKAVAELHAATRYMRKGDPLSARRLPLMQEASPERDLVFLRRLARHVRKDNFPYPAFAAFARSLERYNDIRRTVRPNKVTRPQEERLIRRRLVESISYACVAVGLLSAPRYRRFRRNVEHWLRHVEEEFAGVRPPAYEVLPESAVAPADNFAPLVHDQCFRYAENCIQDLDAFWSDRDWERPDDVSFRIASARDGLVLSLLERGVPARARRNNWREYRGTRGETFFWRFYVGRASSGNHMDVWSILTEGRSALKGAFTILSRQHTVLRTGQPVKGGRGKLTLGRDWWRIDYRLPWRLLGGPAKRGETWRVNITAVPNSGVPLLPTEDNFGRNRQYVWCRGYEFTAANDFMAGKPERMGTVTFA